ncbi:MAG: insulinase family protein [Deltaproteobacteria bacterium HGW-Deltaproteobacteria-14]|nr:MAG: insulinase family protein [Deltaproteobacteria bacterium HGW-Deltaproteobacteria-14]
MKRLTLENGLKLLMIPLPADGLVSYWSVVRTGSRDEVEAGVTGFAHFFEHMMFRGSENFPGSAYDEIISGIGADANAYTTDDYTAYHLSFIAEDLPKVVEVEADRFQRLAYDEPGFKTEAGAVYGEYRKGRTSPWSVLYEKLQDAAFDAHTYKHTTMGFEADIQKMPERFAYSKTFYQRYYRPENVVIVVAGDIDTAAVEKLVMQRYGDWKPGYVAPEVPVEPEQTAARRVDVPFDGKTLPMLAVMFKGDRLQPGDTTMIAAQTIGELAFGETSPLYKKLVLDEQRVERLYASFDDQRDPGLWGVLAMVKDPGDVRAVEREIMATVADLRERPVEAARLAAVRSNMKYGFLSSMTTPDEVAGHLAPIVALTGDVTAVDERFATLDRVTPADVQAAAAKYLTVARSTVATLHSRDQAIPEAAAPAPAPSEAPAPSVAPTPTDAPAAVATPPATPVEAAPAGTLKAAPVLLPVPTDPLVAFEIQVKVGSQDDPPGKEGLAALTAALIGDGSTRQLAYEAILGRLFPMAAGYGAAVDRELTVIRGQVHRDFEAAFGDLIVAAVTEPAFAEADFERLKSEAKSYIENTLRFTSDEELGKAVLYQAAFAGTPYAHIEDGTVAALDAITLDDVRAFYRAHYTRDNVALGLGGGYTAELPAKIAAALGRLPAGDPGPAPEIEPTAPKGRQVTIVEKPGPSTAISFGYPIDVHRGSREFYALWLATSWLGEHRNSVSHLYQVIREERGMNYGDYAYIEAFPNGGRRQVPPTGVARRAQLFEVWIRPVKEDQALFALRAALREVELLGERGLSPQQFEGHRRFLVKYLLHFAETTAAKLGYAVDDRFYAVDGHLALARKTMAQLTLEEVNAAVKRWVQAKDVHIALVTEHAQALADALVAGGPSPMSYPAGSEKAPETLAEDVIIQAWPLGVAREQVKIVPVSEVFER